MKMVACGLLFNLLILFIRLVGMLCHFRDCTSISFNGYCLVLNMSWFDQRETFHFAAAESFPIHL
jgi:hypothetical protein